MNEQDAPQESLCYAAGCWVFRRVNGKRFSQPDSHKGILPGAEVALGLNQFVNRIVLHNATSNYYMYSNFQIIHTPEPSNAALPSQARPF